MYFRVGTFPGITSVSPGQGPAGTAVTINGQNFGATQVSGSTVTFNGVAAGPATTWTNTQIVVSVHRVPVPYRFTYDDRRWEKQRRLFAVQNPSITSLSQTSAAVELRHYSGANFGATQGTSTVKLMELGEFNGSGWSAST